MQLTSYLEISPLNASLGMAYLNTLPTVAIVSPIPHPCDTGFHIVTFESLESFDLVDESLCCSSSFSGMLCKANHALTSFDSWATTAHCVVHESVLRNTVVINRVRNAESQVCFLIQAIVLIECSFFLFFLFHTKQSPGSGSSTNLQKIVSIFHEILYLKM